MTIYYSPSTNGFYDSDLNYPSLPSDVIEISRQVYNALLEGNHKHNKEIFFNGTEPALRDYTPPPISWDNIRAKRDKLLRNTDYTDTLSFKDREGESVYNLWYTYRQSLRDIPQTYASPEQVIWPTPPGA